MKKVTVGIPVYNGEKSIKKAIDSVLNQTFMDFEIIISDNASTDSTKEICEEYSKNNDEITYIRQKKNLGYIKNFLYTLNYTESKYFVWLSADDFWEPTFLEKNISILDSKKDIVGSVGKIGIIGNYYHKFDYDQNDNIIIKFYKKIRQHYLSLEYFGTYGGKYKDRVRMCLKSFRYGLFIFSVFRTDVLKKSANFHIIPWDWGLILLILKYGNLHVIDEVLQYRNPGGISNSNAISFFRQRNIQLYHLLFPQVPFTKWCIKNLGLKIFFQNIIFFIRINCSGPIVILLDLLKYFRLQTNRKNYYFEKDLLPE